MMVAGCCDRRWASARLRLRRAALSLAAGLPALFMAAEGRANGEDDFTIGVYAGQPCASLRQTALGQNDGVGVDVILTCLEQTGSDKRSCSRLVPGTEGGGALGFCPDGFFGASPAPVVGDVLEANKSIRQTSFGGVTNLEDGTIFTDTFCQTFAPSTTTGGSGPGRGGGGGGGSSSVPQGRKFCVTFDSGVFPPDDTTAEKAHPLPVVKNQTVCDAVAGRLNGAVARGQQPVFVALISAALKNVSKPTVLVACGNYGWQRIGEPSGPGAVNGQNDLRIVDTPRLLCYNGRC